MELSHVVSDEQGTIERHACEIAERDLPERFEASAHQVPTVQQVWFVRRAGRVSLNL